MTTDPAATVPLADFEAWLGDWLARRPAHPRLAAAMAEAALSGGKRFRAVLVMLAAKLQGTPPHAAYPAAGAVELIHAYSLAHDDLPSMDDAALRRGRATLHRSYGEATALLAGDGLLTDAFGLLAETEAAPARVLAALRDLATAAGMQGMVSGQMGDMLDLPHATDVDTVRAIHARKTGALIRWSLQAPTVLWPRDGAHTEVVGRFAEHLGVLYQVRDDLLDLDPEATRDKDRGADEGKSTYARLLGVEGARRAAEEELAACLEAAADLPVPHDAVFAGVARWTAGRTT